MPDRAGAVRGRRRRAGRTGSRRHDRLCAAPRGSFEDAAASEATWTFHSANERSIATVAGAVLSLAATGSATGDAAYAYVDSRESSALAHTQVVADVGFLVEGEGDALLYWWSEATSEWFGIDAYQGTLFAIHNIDDVRTQLCTADCPAVTGGTVTLSLWDDGEVVRFGTSTGGRPYDWFASASSIPGTFHLKVHAFAAQDGDVAEATVDRVRWLDCVTPP